MEEQKLSNKELKLKQEEEKKLRRAEKLAKRDPELLQQSLQKKEQQLKVKGDQKISQKEQNKLKQQTQQKQNQQKDEQNQQKDQQNQQKDQQNQQKDQQNQQKDQQNQQKDQQNQQKDQQNQQKNQQKNQEPKVIEQKKQRFQSIQSNLNKHSILSHLKEYETAEMIKTVVSGEKIHPELIRYAIRIKNDILTSSNDKCKEFLIDLQSQNNSFFKKDLQQEISKSTIFLEQSNVILNEGSKNCLQFFKQKLTELPVDQEEDQAKAYLIQQLDSHIEKKINQSIDLIVKNNMDLIKNGDTILTYANGCAVSKLLIQSHQQGKKFDIIVCENPPFNEGRQLIQALNEHNIRCVFTTLSSVPNFMNQVTKVFLSASSILINGTLISRCGTSMLACMANYHAVPVIVFCESYKFSQRSQLDAFSHNELGNPQDISSNDQDGDKKYTVMNLKWDLTPTSYIKMIVTEMGKYPATSVPIILNEFNKQNQSESYNEYIS